MTELIPFTAKQRRSITRSDEWVNIWDGSVRSSKTVTSLFAWTDFLLEAPPGDLALIGKTQTTLRRNIVYPWEELVVGHDLEIDKWRSEAHLWGRRMYMVGANDDRAEKLIRGMTVAGWLGDEVSTWPKGFFDMLLSRASVNGARGFGTTNPEGPNHWLMRDYLSRADQLSLRRWRFRLDDNPALGETFKRNLKAFYVPGSLHYRRFIDGDWVMAEGAIYGDSFDEPRVKTPHRPDGNRSVTRRVGIDYGTSNPFVWLTGVIAPDPVDDVERLWITHEWRHAAREVQRQMTDAEYSSALRDFVTENELFYDKLYIDPSAASMARQLKRDGFNAITGADNDVDEGIRVCNALFGNDRIRIHESCEHLLRAIPSYVWDPKAQERGIDQPLKRDDDECDALRYLVMGLRQFWRRWLMSSVSADTTATEGK